MKSFDFAAFNSLFITMRIYVLNDVFNLFRSCINNFPRSIFNSCTCVCGKWSCGEMDERTSSTVWMSKNDVTGNGKSRRASPSFRCVIKVLGILVDMGSHVSKPRSDRISSPSYAPLGRSAWSIFSAASAKRQQRCVVDGSCCRPSHCACVGRLHSLFLVHWFVSCAALHGIRYAADGVLWGSSSTGRRALVGFACDYRSCVYRNCTPVNDSRDALLPYSCLQRPRSAFQAGWGGFLAERRLKCPLTRVL